MVTGDEEIKYGYLLDPCFQMVNTGGKPLTQGWIEVYVAGTRYKYYCSSDFAGTLHPFKIPLDSLGSNIILADVEKSYDVYVYNKFGNLVMSRYNITPGKGGAGGSVSGSGSAEHWIGKNGQSISVPAGSDTALNLPTSFEYEGSFIDHIDENRTAFYLKEGLYLVQAVVNFKQSDLSLTNEISQVDVFTRSDDAPEDMSFNRDMAGPDSSDDSHCLKISFIRCVKEDDAVSQVVLFKVNTPNAWSECYLQNVQIAKLSSGGAGQGGRVYHAGQYIEIDEGTDTISVTGIEPDTYLTSGDLDGYATEQWVLDKHYITSADIPPLPDDLVTSAELAQTSGLIEQDIADLTSAISESLSEKMDKSSSADFYPRYSNPDGYITSADVPEQEQSDWSETDSGDVSYIKNKPTILGIENGRGISISQSSSAMTISTSDDFVNSAFVDSLIDDKTSAFITSADIPPQIEYSAGDNIDITNHVVSVTDTSQLIAGDNISITASGTDYIISAQVPADLVTSADLATVSGEIVNQIPSLDGYATEEYVTEHTSAFITSADLPDVSDMATKTWVGEQGYLTSIPSEYVTETELASELSGKMDSSESSAFYPMATNPSGYLVSSDLNGYATEQYVQDETSAFITSADLPSEEEVEFEELDTSTFVDSAYVTSYVSSQTSGKQDSLTFGYTDNKISSINSSAIYSTGGGGVSQVNSDWDATSGVAEILNKPDTEEVEFEDLDLSGYVTSAYVTDYVTSQTSAFITSADLPDLSTYATQTWVGQQGYITSVPAEYVTSAQLSATSAAIENDIPDVTDMATKTWSTNSFFPIDGIQIVGSSAEASGANIIYIVSGSNA